ncbi:MAG: hypothetical protein ACJAVS_000198 [Paracoccaceae bacterium]
MKRPENKDHRMGIDDESDITADLQIGPTSDGMVRLYIEGEGFGIPLDFFPEEAEEIAEEILAAVERARAAGASGGKSGKKNGPSPRRKG